jgi:thioredoxin reductase (NADPH)
MKKESLIWSIVYLLQFTIVLSNISIFSSFLKNSNLLSRGGNKESDKNEIVKEVVIIGSGPAGCTAGIYASRALLKPLVIAGYQSGGQLMLTSDIENFPGYSKAISGPDMMNDLFSQARSFGCEFWMVNCNYIDTSQYPYKVHLSNGTISTKTIIIATGAESIWLNAPREEEFKGKGISTCATCDGYMFRNKSVIVVGGGDSAMEEATFLTRFASSVTIIHRSETFKASKVNFNYLLY